MLGAETFWDYVIAVQAKNSLLFSVESRLPEDKLCHNLKAGIVRIPATSYLVPLFTLIYLVLFHLLPPYHLDVPCYLNNRQRYCSVWSEGLGLFTRARSGFNFVDFGQIFLAMLQGTFNPYFTQDLKHVNLFLCLQTQDSYGIHKICKV